MGNEKGALAFVYKCTVMLLTIKNFSCCLQEHCIVSGVIQEFSSEPDQMCAR